MPESAGYSAPCAVVSTPTAWRLPLKPISSGATGRPSFEPRASAM